MQTGTMTPPRSQGGAPRGNRNAARNGSRAVVRLTLGEYPKEMWRHLATARKYRRELETFVVDRRGEVDIIAAHYIDEACGAELHAAACRWLLRTKLAEMSAGDFLNCSREILKAKGVRNRALEKLKLTQDDRNVFDALYTVHDDPMPTDDPTAAFPNPTAADDPSIDPAPSNAICDDPQPMEPT